VEAELKEERKQKAISVNRNKELEKSLEDYKQQIGMVNKMREDALKELHCIQAEMIENQQELEGARIAKEKMKVSVKESEQKLKSLDANLLQLQENLAAAEKAKRNAEVEIDELMMDEFGSNTSGKMVLLEKRYMEANLQCDEELEEGQSNSDMLNDRARRSLNQFGQLTELVTEKALTQKMEIQRSALEKQNKDLKEKLAIKQIFRQNGRSYVTWRKPSLDVATEEDRKRKMRSVVCAVSKKQRLN
jgi:myosin protein heavy chain